MERENNSGPATGRVSARWKCLVRLGLFLFLAGYGSILLLEQPAAASNACVTELKSGSGGTYMDVCISDTGNLVKFQSPIGFDQIGQLNLWRDGYAICTIRAFPFIIGTDAYDNGGEAAGFDAPTTVQPNGPNTLPLTITQITSNGVYELTQSYARDTLKRDLVVTMKVTRLTNGDCASPLLGGCPGVGLARYYEGDVDNNTVTNSIFNLDADSLWEWVNAAGHHGLMLSDVNNSASHTTSLVTHADFDPFGTGFHAAEGCATANSAAASTTDGADLHGILHYGLGTIPVGTAKTVKVDYRRF